MSERTDKDLERIAEEALDRLARGWDPMGGPGEALDPDDEAHVVSHLEALSLLAYAAEPEAPSAAVKSSLLAAVAAEPRIPSAAPSPRPVAVPPAMPSAGANPVDVTLREIPTLQAQVAREVGQDVDPGDMTLVGLGTSDGSHSGPGLDVGDVREFRSSGDVEESLHGSFSEPTSFSEATVKGRFTPPPRAANSNTPLYLLAAGLVVCLVGLGYLYGQLQTQNAQNIAVQARLQTQVEQARSEAESMRTRVQMVTDVARMAYPMRQVATNGASVRTVSRPEPGEVRPDGIVYVCGQHQRWYLSLSGFEPAPDGQVYHLWFKTEDGAIDAGPLKLTDDGRADVGDLSMPEGTQGFLVSLEDVAEEDGEPHGQIILKGDQPVKL